jgi:protein tyrosine phosphatase
VIEQQLAGAHRRRYGSKRGQVRKSTVDAWLNEAKDTWGVRSIICLLDEYHLQLYEKLPVDLISYYREGTRCRTHSSQRYRQRPALSEQHLKRASRAYERLQKPVLVHCSAGMGCTGKAVSYINRKLSLESLGR